MATSVLGAEGLGEWVEYVVTSSCLMPFVCIHRGDS